ncbi:hypothetical protein AB4Z48_18145 [Cupriavidus sp. 2TAF22]|uniref:hypothetical protein n=1 Tax=unclassified Cupriavidus TaxID=2640874 RepID=UPI003F8DE516
MDTEPKATVAELLHAAFLRGEKIAPPEFAKRIGVSRVAVCNALREHFAGLLREEQPNGTRIGGLLVCISMEEMRNWKPRSRPAPAQSAPAVPLSQALRAAFLRGEKVVASTFSERGGYTRQGTSDALKRMSQRGMISFEMVRPNGRGNAAMVWTCIDEKAMQAYQPMEPGKHVRFVGGGAGFSALLDVWGIELVDIALPCVQHRIDVPEDEMEVS